MWIYGPTSWGIETANIQRNSNEFYPRRNCKERSKVSFDAHIYSIYKKKIIIIIIR